MKRKGMMASTLAKIILVLFIAIPLMFFIGKITLFAGERSDVEACRLSVFAATKSKIAGKSLFENINCPQMDLTIKAKDVIKKGKINDDLVKGKLSEALYTCWNMVGEGKLDPYQDWDGNKKY